MGDCQWCVCVCMCVFVCLDVVLCLCKLAFARVFCDSVCASVSVLWGNLCCGVFSCASALRFYASVFVCVRVYVCVWLCARVQTRARACMLCVKVRARACARGPQRVRVCGHGRGIGPRRARVCDARARAGSRAWVCARARASVFCALVRLWASLLVRSCARCALVRMCTCGLRRLRTCDSKLTQSHNYLRAPKRVPTRFRSYAHACFYARCALVLLRFLRLRAFYHGHLLYSN